MRISIIYSCKDELDNPFFHKNLVLFEKLRNQTEIIFVDGSDKPGTRKKINERGYPLIEAPDSNRAQRYNKGARLSTGDLILFHHPRSSLAEGFLDQLRSLESRKMWGAFTHRFDHDSPGYRFTSWYSNCIRGDLARIYYADHCLFCSRDLFDAVGGIPDVDIFEDTLFCQLLRSRAKPVRLPLYSTTSSIRFARNGFFKQAWLNQKLKLQFYFNFRHTQMNQVYEKKLNLNETVGSKKGGCADD